MIIVVHLQLIVGMDIVILEKVVLQTILLVLLVMHVQMDA